MLKNLIRIGKISSVNAVKGTVRVVIEDQQDIVTDELPMLAFEYYMPEVGNLVLCAFLGNGISQGVCLGRYFSDQNPPPVTNPKIYSRDFGDGTSIQYNKTSKELSISAAGDLTISVEGNLTISVKGNITSSADGSITTTAGLANIDIGNAKTSPVTHHP